MTAKYIRLFSDVHLDFDIPIFNGFNPSEVLWKPIELDTDKETILILAGDIWHAKKPFAYMNYSWFKDIANRFHSVIIVLGNHDLWHGNITFEYNKVSNYIIEQNIKNLYLLQNNTIIISNNKFIGGTLWTNFNEGSTESIALANEVMNDFKYIKSGNTFSKSKPPTLMAEFNKTYNYIKAHNQKDYSEQKVWVVTHHAPSELSIKDKMYQSLDSSNLDSFIETSSIDVWCHGHTHKYCDYNIGNTKIYSNPRGYEKFNDLTNYNKYMLLDLDGKLLK